MTPVTLTIEARSWKVINWRSCLCLPSVLIWMPSAQNYTGNIAKTKLILKNNDPVTLKFEPRSQQVNWFKVLFMAAISENLKAIANIKGFTVYYFFFKLSPVRVVRVVQGHNHFSSIVTRVPTSMVERGGLLSPLFSSQAAISSILCQGIPVISNHCIQFVI